MSEYVTVTIHGLDELQKKLEELPVKVAKKGLRKALRSGASIIKNAIVTLAPKDTGFLSEHFSTKLSMRRDELAGSIFIGPQGRVDYPLSGGGYRTRHRKNGKIIQAGRIAVATVARFLEFGTSKMSKRPFMTSAFESTKGAAQYAMIAAIKDAVENV